MIRSLLLVWIFLPLTAATAQPFGIAEGTPLSKLEVLRQTGSAYVVKPRLSHPEFEEYIVNATKEAGVCTITAIGQTYHNDADGSQAESAFGSLTEQLAQKYGHSRFFNFLHHGSIWTEPGEWTMSIYKNDRSYSRFWDKDERSTMKNDLKSAMLTVKALGSDETYLVLRFEFNNADSYIAAQTSAGASAL